MRCGGGGAKRRGVGPPCSKLLASNPVTDHRGITNGSDCELDRCAERGLVWDTSAKVDTQARGWVNTFYCASGGEWSLLFNEERLRLAASPSRRTTRGRSHRRPAATARRGCLVSCETSAAAFARHGQRRPAPCKPVAAPDAPTRARTPAFAAARAARGPGRLRIPTMLAYLPHTPTVHTRFGAGG